MAHTGRWVGVACGLAMPLLWGLLAIRALESENGLRPGTVAVATAAVTLSLLGAFASWRARPGWMLASALLSFVPVGFYLLLTVGATQIIGALQLTLMAAAALIWIGRPQAP